MGKEKLIFNQVKPVTETRTATGFPPDILERAAEIVSRWVEKERLLKGYCHSEYEIGFDHKHNPVVVKIGPKGGGVIEQLVPTKPTSNL